MPGTHSALIAAAAEGGARALAGRARRGRSRRLDRAARVDRRARATRSCGSCGRGTEPDGLRALDRTGLLAQLIPEWVDVRCRPQRDPYHRYTVDVHLLRAFERMSRALVAPDEDDPLEVAAAALIDERDGALLGALLHDVGKNGEGGHVLDRRPAGGHDPRAHGRRGADGRAGAVHGGRAPAAAGHRHTAGPRRRRHDPGRRGAGRDARNGSRRSTSWRRRTRSPRVRPRGRRGARRLIRELVSKVQRVLRARRDGRGGRRTAHRCDRHGPGPAPRGDPRTRSNGSSCGCRGATSCRSRPNRSSGTTRRSRADLGRQRRADRDAPRKPAGHVRAARGGRRPARPALVDRRRAVAGRALHPDGPGLHDRRRGGRRPVRGAGSVRSRW